MSVAREYKDIEARGSKQISLISDLDSEFAMELPLFSKERILHVVSIPHSLLI
jgi:hypothetical protein